MQTILQSTEKVIAFQSEINDEGDPHLKKEAQCQKEIGSASVFVMWKIDELIMLDSPSSLRKYLVSSLKWSEYSASMHKIWESISFDNSLSSLYVLDF